MNLKQINKLAYIFSKKAEYESDSEDLEAASDTGTDPETLAELAKSDNAYIQLAVAENPSTPIGALEELAKSDNDIVQGASASNPVIPPEVADEYYAE